MLYELLPKRDEKWEAIADELHKALLYKKQYEQMADQLSEKLKQLSNNESSRGNNYIYLCSHRKGSIPYNDIPVIKEILKTLNIDSYRKEDIQTWKLIKM